MRASTLFALLSAALLTACRQDLAPEGRRSSRREFQWRSSRYGAGQPPADDVLITKDIESVTCGR